MDLEKRVELNYVVRDEDEVQVGVDVDEIKSKIDRPHFTWRSAIVGSALGCLVGASNLYLGMKTGWTFSASLFSSIFSYILIKLSISLIPSMDPTFTVMESCTATTAATTSGGLNVGFMTCIPAMYRLGLLSEDPMDDIVRLFLWTLAGATYGMFFAIPLRSWFVIKNELPFPTPRAAAETIKLLHSKYEGSQTNRVNDKFYVLFAAFLSSFLLNLSAHWIQILDKIHILYWLGRSFGWKFIMSFDVVWGWYFEPNFAFLGAGFILPPNTSLSYLLGTIICYGVTGPILLSTQFIVGASGFKSSGNGTAQSLFLWSGIALLLFSSFTEVFIYLLTSIKKVNSPYNAFLDLCKNLKNFGISTKSDINRDDGVVSASEMKLKSEEIPRFFWLGGILLSSFMSCFVMAYFFSIPIYQTILSVIMAFILGIVAIQATAETDINPVSTVAKVVQLIFVNFPANSLIDLQRNNMLTACITAAGAAQSADMVMDLKIGHLLETSPKSQFYAQLVGTVVGILYSVPLFLLYAKAYPCIITDTDTCEFGMSSALAWQNTTLLLTKGLKLPTTALVLAIAFALFAVCFTIVKHLYVPKKYHHYLINLNAIGVGFIISQPSIPIIMTLGLVISTIWRYKHTRSHTELSLGLGAGLIAGAGIAAAIKAAFTIAGVHGNNITWGSVPL